MPYQDDDDDDGPRVPPGARRFFEFECPTCSAHNPWGDGFKNKDDISCHYCGAEFEVRVSSEGVLKLKSQ